METASKLFARNVEDALDKKGWGQADLARALKKAAPEISKLLSGKANPTLETMADIAAKLGLTLEELFKGGAEPRQVEHTPAQCAAALHAFHSKPEGQTLYQTRAAEIPADITAALVKIAGEPLLLDAVRAQLKIKPANPDVEIFSADQSSIGLPSKSKKA